MRYERPEKQEVSHPWHLLCNSWACSPSHPEHDLHVRHRAWAPYQGWSLQLTVTNHQWNRRKFKLCWANFQGERWRNNNLSQVEKVLADKRKILSKALVIYYNYITGLCGSSYTSKKSYPNQSFTSFITPRSKETWGPCESCQLSEPAHDLHEKLLIIRISLGAQWVITVLKVKSNGHA